MFCVHACGYICFFLCIAIDSSYANSKIHSSVYWNPNGALDRVASLDDGFLRIWRLETLSSLKPSETFALAPTEKRGGLARSTRASWSPTSGHVIATANDLSVRGWDLRSQRDAFCIDRAHSVLVRDVDFNPNVSHQLLSAGDDGLVRVWDTRSTRSSIKEIRVHSHWVWRAQYNRFHDQLVLSAGSDAKVVLSSIASVSSANTLSSAAAASDEEDDDENRHAHAADAHRGGKVRDGVVMMASDQHDDSIYAVAWSAADPWVFASVSWDGRIVFNIVPKEEKYKILL